MIKIRRNPGNRRVAVVAVVAGLDMRRMLARGDRTVVTRHAGANNLRVINRIRRRPDHVVMAVFTDIGCIDVSLAFAGRSRAVVTTEAAVDDASMIEVRRNPCSRCMAIVAIVTARDMRRVLAYCYRVVMAGYAGTDHLGVVDTHCRNPQVRSMTILTHVRCIDMSLVLTGRCSAIVTAEAVISDTDVIKRRRYPGNGRMAVVTGVTARNVCRVFANSNRAIVA